jgi:hypothetical protein
VLLYDSSLWNYGHAWMNDRKHITVKYRNYLWNTWLNFLHSLILSASIKED